ncbi:hypothetical protein ACNKHT_22935 [Shigella flexneri]
MTKWAKPLITSTLFFTDGLIGSLNTVDIGGTAGDQRFPVEFIDSGIKTIIRAVHGSLYGFAPRATSAFFRHTANIYAGATQLFGFNQRTFLAVVRRAVDGGDPPLPPPMAM